MSKQFVIAVDIDNPLQESMVTEYLKSKTGWWWHWIKNFWLTIDKTNTLTATQLRDDIKIRVPGNNILIIEVPVGSPPWSGFGPNSETDKRANMFEWLHKEWDSK